MSRKPLLYRVQFLRKRKRSGSRHKGQHVGELARGSESMQQHVLEASALISQERWPRATKLGKA